MPTLTLAEIQNLPVDERLRLVEVIWDTLAATPEQVPLTQSQSDEIDRRLSAFEKDEAQGLSWDAVKKDITARP